MKSFAFTLATIFLAAGSASAQNSTMATSTIVIKPGCPSAPAGDVMVTRSAVAVPTCEAGNATKPMIVSMSGYGMVSATPTGGNPAQYTGAASSNRIGAMAIVGGVLAGLVF